MRALVLGMSSLRVHAQVENEADVLSHERIRGIRSDRRRGALSRPTQPFPILQLHGAACHDRRSQGNVLCIFCFHTVALLDMGAALRMDTDQSQGWVLTMPPTCQPENPSLWTGSRRGTFSKNTMGTTTFHFFCAASSCRSASLINRHLQ